MGIRSKQPDANGSPQMLVALTSWCTDDPDGEPVAVREGERFKPDSWVAQKFGGWLADASLPSWEIESLSRKATGHR